MTPSESPVLKYDYDHRKLDFRELDEDSKPACAYSVVPYTINYITSLVTGHLKGPRSILSISNK